MNYYFILSILNIAGFLQVWIIMAIRIISGQEFFVFNILNYYGQYHARCKKRIEEVLSKTPASLQSPWPLFRVMYWEVRILYLHRISLPKESSVPDCWGVGCSYMKGEILRSSSRITFNSSRKNSPLLV